MFTKFLYDVEALLLLLMRAYTWLYCIPFRNARAKTEGGQFRHLQKVFEINLLKLLSSLESPYICLPLLTIWWRLLQYLLRYSVWSVHFCPVLCPVVAKISISVLVIDPGLLYHISPNFYTCSHVIITIYSCIHIAILQFVVVRQSKEKTRSIYTSANGPKINWLP